VRSSCFHHLVTRAYLGGRLQSAASARVQQLHRHVIIVSSARRVMAALAFLHAIASVAAVAPAAAHPITIT
jgi:hypothetical protein